MRNRQAVKRRFPVWSSLAGLRAASAIVLVMVLALTWLPKPRRGRRTALAWRLIMWGFAIRVRIHGSPRPGRTLFVANHVSWTDIVALGHAVDAGFVAKHEVAGWPVLGALARGYGCLFIDRQRRGKTGVQVAALRGSVNAALIVFPEGTTHAGPAPRAFRSSLFAIADGDDRRVVQPVALVHRGGDGALPDAARRRRLAWIDDDTLAGHMAMLLADGGTVIDVWFEPPLPEGDRKTLAREAQAAITRRLLAECSEADQAAKRAT
jgi:1-acyl-sn-glycerol-3-phosphate acyltransferase